GFLSNQKCRLTPTPPSQTSLQFPVCFQKEPNGPFHLQIRPALRRRCPCRQDRRRGRHAGLHLLQGHPHHALPSHRRGLCHAQTDHLLLHQILRQRESLPHPPRRRLRHGCHLRRRAIPRAPGRRRSQENLLRRRRQDRQGNQRSP